MGGLGSGGYHGFSKYTVGQYTRLDAHKVATTVGTDRKCYTGWRWTWETWQGESEASINFWMLPDVGHAGAVQLRYSYGGEPVEPYTVRFDTTRPHFGGLRYWWRCPTCGRRCAHIYGGRLFLCRLCHNLTYASCQTAGDPLERARRKLQAIFDKLGAGMRIPTRDTSLPDKPPYMHWDTYGRLMAEYWHWQEVETMAFVGGVSRITGSLPSSAWEALQNEDTDGFVSMARAADPDLFPMRTFKEIQQDWLEGLIQGLERELEREAKQREPKRTLGEIAKAGGVPYEFAKEAQREGLIRPDRGRGKRVKRYRPKLASWLSKLYTMQQSGLSWEEIRDWTQRRFAPGHEHERRWPAGFEA
jgi:hypothetical protein